VEATVVRGGGRQHVALGSGRLGAQRGFVEPDDGAEVINVLITARWTRGLSLEKMINAGATHTPRSATTLSTVIASWNRRPATGADSAVLTSGEWSVGR
jgi:hypothetical protein